MDWSAFALSLKLAVGTMVILLPVGIWLGRTLAWRRFGGKAVVMAGGFSDETHVFKVLALGAPNFKAVCMGRALMIPGMVGKNIGEWIKAGTLPKTVSKFGAKADEIFVSYEELKAKYGKDVEKIPLGAVGICTASQKIRTGRQPQLQSLDDQAQRPDEPD